MKKFFTLFAAALMSIGMFAGTVVSVDCGKNGNNLVGVLDTEGVLTITGSGEMKDFTYGSYPAWVSVYAASVKSIVINDGATSIGNNAFRGCENVTSVTIPNGITRIGESAFYNCSSLTSITIPGSVTEIKDYAFRLCRFTSFNLSKNVESIGVQVFVGCPDLTAIEVDAGNPNYCDINGVLYNKNKTKLIHYPQAKSATSCTIPGSVTEIINFAFYQCPGLNSITCKATTPPALSNNSFFNTTGLAHIYVPAAAVDDYKKATNWSAKASIIEAAAQAVGDTITYTYKGNTLYYKITKKNESGKEAAAVNEGLPYPTFWNAAHKPTGDVVIPDSIEDFMGTKYGVTEIGSDAFHDCTGITSIDFSENKHITTTSGSMCDGCTSLTSVILSDYITTISSYGFRGCPLSSIDLKNVKKIGMSNFGASTFTTVHIPASLEELEDQSYLCYHATTVTCATENTHFAVVDNVLYNKELTKVIALPCGYTAGQEVHLPSTVTSMAFSALKDFTGKLYINSEITCNDTGWRNSPIGAVVVGCGLYDYYTTGDYAGTNSNFLYVTSLTKSLLWSVTATAGGHATVAVTDTTNCNEVSVAVSNVESGYTFVGWSNGATTATTTYEVASDTIIAANVLKNTAVGDYINYPAGGKDMWFQVRSIAPREVALVAKDNWASAFSGALTIPATIKDAFGDEFTVVEIAMQAVRTQSQITSVTIPEGIRRIDAYAFQQTGLTSVTLPSTIEFIGTFAFSSCNYLAEVHFAGTDHLKHIIVNAFGYTSFIDNAEDGWVIVDSVAIDYKGTSPKVLCVPDSVVFIGMLKSGGSFTSSYSLTQSIRIGHKVRALSMGAFGEFYNATSFATYTPVPPAIDHSATKPFRNRESSMRLQLSCELSAAEVAAYKAAYYWKDYYEGIDEGMMPSITVIAENGTVKRDTTDCNEVKITITPASGYAFVGWDNGETANPLTVAITKDTTLKANFAQLITAVEVESIVFPKAGENVDNLMVTLAAGSHCSVAGKYIYSKDNSFPYGSTALETNHEYSAQVKVVPDEGYVFADAVTITVPGKSAIKMTTTASQQIFYVLFDTTPTAIDHVQSDEVQCTKVIRDGQLYLMYKGQMYNVQGAEVK